MDIDAVVFTPSAPVWHIQGQALHLYIMGDSIVPWFGPTPPIGFQGTQKATGGMATRHDDGDRQHDDGKGQQGDRQNDDGNGRQDDGNGRQDDGDGRQDDGDGRHDDGKGQKGDGRHDDPA